MKFIWRYPLNHGPRYDAVGGGGHCVAWLRRRDLELWSCLRYADVINITQDCYDTEPPRVLQREPVDVICLVAARRRWAVMTPSMMSAVTWPQADDKRDVRTGDSDPLTGGSKGEAGAAMPASFSEWSVPR